MLREERFGERMIFYGDEYMHIRPVHCDQPMGPILIGPVGPMPLQSHRGLRKGLSSTGKRKWHAGKRPYGLIINYELKQIRTQTEAP